MLARPSEQRYRQTDRHGQDRTTVRYHRANQFTNGGNTDTLRENTYYIFNPVIHIHAQSHGLIPQVHAHLLTIIYGLSTISCAETAEVVKVLLGILSEFSNKNSSGDEIANVNFYTEITHVFSHWGLTSTTAVDR